MAYNFLAPSKLVGSSRTLIAHNRLEPRPRTHEFNRSLRAEVRDAAWLLGRQWLVKEFRAEDRGTPAFAAISMQSAPTNQIKLGTDPVRSYDPRVPLEAQVQAQPILIDAGLRLQMGQAWLRLLRAHGLETFVAAFRSQYPLAAEEEAAGSYDRGYATARTTAEVQEVLATLGAKALDGFQLYKALEANASAAGSTVGAAQGTAANQATANQLAGQFVESYRRLYFTLPGGKAWSVAELEYEFALAAPGADGQPTVLATAGHAGGSLHWHSLDQPSAANNSGFANGTSQPAATERLIPTEIEFIGAPNARWWEFEDRRVDFGNVTGDPSDFGRMLLQDFVFLYQNDWFSIPYDVPVGSVNAVRSLEVTDVFGQRYRIHAAGASDQREPGNGPLIDNDWGRWSLYAQSEPGNRTVSVPQVFVPSTAVSPLVGKPVEQVLFLREEATNLVWAIEQTVPNGFGAGMDGSGAANQVAEYLRSKASAPTPPAAGALGYRLATSVPENWIPFVPRPGGDGVFRLEQGEMLRQVEGLALNAADRTVKPRTGLLQLGGPTGSYAIHEHQVPPTGLRVEGGFRRARGYDGSTHVWFERHRSPGQRGGSSGLRFDQLLPPTSEI
ncbi:MAG TPA: hypothetical protein VF690_14955 [Hymenobacter sp.]